MSHNFATMLTLVVFMANRALLPLLIFFPSCPFLSPFPFYIRMVTTEKYACLIIRFLIKMCTVNVLCISDTGPPISDLLDNRVW